MHAGVKATKLTSKGDPPQTHLVTAAVGAQGPREGGEHMAHGVLRRRCAHAHEPSEASPAV